MSKIIQIELKLANGAIFTIPNFDASAAIPNAPHFTYYEVANPSCKEATKLVINNQFYKHYRNLEALRVIDGKSFVVNSGYRSPSFNKQCGGIETSNHIYGTNGIASDIAMPWITTEALFNEEANKWKAICESDGIVGEALWYKKSHFIHFGSFINYSNKFYKVIYNK